MCGIAGVIHTDGSNPDEGRLLNMRDSMVHRGPDAAGIHIWQQTGLAHRRLSIIDLSDAANQPFHSPCGNYVLVFNGEIFNHNEFRRELTAKGFDFHTQSDTEVLLYLLMAYGSSMLHRLIGFWSFAFLNKKEHSLLLVRDRMGIKPLFYANTNGLFAFTSEPKALFAYGLPKAIATEHLDELLIYRHVSGENTIFNGVKRLLPGHLMQVDTHSGKSSISRWFHLGEDIQNQSPIQKPLEWFEETFQSSIRYRMVSDVPVGTLLSGGLDSSAVLQAQHQLGYKEISAWNIRFSNFSDDESSLASRFSTSLHTPFHSHEFNGEDLVNLTLEALHISDEPFMHNQEPQLLGICKKAKKDVSVLLSGEASDELLGGYLRYKVHDQQWRYRLLQLIRYIPDGLLKNDRWRKMKKYLFIKNQDAQLMMNANSIFVGDLEHYRLGGMNLLPEYRIQVLKEAKTHFPHSPLRQLLYMEQFTHLPSLNDRNDRVSMGASIECREPFQDARLYSGVMSLPDKYFPTQGKGKWLLMNSIGKQLPSYITQHRKIGLSIPWKQYFREIPYFREHLESMGNCELFRMGNFHQLDIGKVVSDAAENPHQDHAMLRQLFFMSLWYRQSFESAV